MKNYQSLLIGLLILTGGLLAGFSIWSPSEKSKPGAGDIDRQVDSLLAIMTIDEKIGQMVQYSGYAQLTGPGEKKGRDLEKYNQIKSGGVGSMLNVTSAVETRRMQKLAVENSRLGIPLLFGYDVIHGYKTNFPIPLGEAASWDLEIIEASARAAAREASAAGLHWTFAPMVDISRDARWGRNMEGAGEDPFLASQISVARVRGFQGEDLSSPHTIAACAKHFAAYGFVEAGREYNTVDISEHTLHNVVLPPFKACVDAGVATIMNAFNEIGGVPATGNSYLQRDILKGKWGFEGFVVSDWATIAELVVHGVAEDDKEAALQAIKAGSDMDMEGYCYQKHLKDLVKEGKVDEALIDDAAARILRLKFQLGLMDDPYKYSDPKREQAEILSEEKLTLAREVARRSIVLLKNDRNILPLSETGGPIAVIGPLADDKDTPLGNWRGQTEANSAVSLLEGLRAAIGDKRKITYAPGCVLSDDPWSFHQEITINEKDRSLIPEAVALARKAERVILVVGEDAQQSGEARSQVNIGLRGVQQELAQAIFEANPNTVVVLMNGRPIAVPELKEQATAIVEAWHLGSQAGHAIADILLGKYNPSAKLPVSFPRHVGQCPLYYARKKTGRPESKGDVFWSHYTDESNDALWPFGYGLSYTTFSYGPIKLNTDRLRFGDSLQTEITVTNTGPRAGEEIVQLYVRDRVGSLTRPVKELKGFEKIELQPGEKRKVSFTLTSDDLAFYTGNNRWEAEPGTFDILIGPNSAELQSATFKLIPVNEQ